MWIKSFGPDITQNKATVLNKLTGIMRDYDNKGMQVLSIQNKLK